MVDKKMFLFAGELINIHPNSEHDNTSILTADIFQGSLKELTQDADGFIEFKLIRKNPKTDVIQVLSKDGIELGIIQWYPAWRHYVFTPEPDTTYSDRCQLAIGLKTMELNEEHKKKLSIPPQSKASGILEEIL